MPALPVVAVPEADELLSSWLLRTAEYYRVTVKTLLVEIGCETTDVMAVDRAATALDVDALSSALHASAIEIRRRSFIDISAPALTFVSAWLPLRRCEPCHREFIAGGATTISLRQWQMVFARNCRRCGGTLRPNLTQPAECPAGQPDSRLEEFVRGALERTLDDEAVAAALARTMAALATPLPTGIAYSSRVERPLLWRDDRYRAEVIRRRRAAADPERPFAAWSVVAQAAALRLIDQIVFADTAWEHLSEFGLVEADDLDVVRRTLSLAAGGRHPGCTNYLQ